MTVRDTSQRPYTWPCSRMGTQSPCTTTCEKRDLMTPEDLVAEEREIRAAIDAAVRALEEGKCFECGAPIEPSKVIGRCRYASCGHRVGQAL